jgi:FHA domain
MEVDRMPGPTDIEQGRIDETLAAYRELQQRFDRVRDRLRLAEQHRQSVNRRVYDKVRAEYDRELDALRASMTPLRDKLDGLRASIEEGIHEAAGRLEAVEEELAEAVFRHTIGEYTDDEIAERRRELESHLAEERAAVERLKQTQAVLEVKEQDEPAGAEDLADEPVVTPHRPVLKAAHLSTRAAAPAADASASEAPAAKPAAAAPAETPATGRRMEPSRADGFENPHDWIDEIPRDARGDRRTAAAETNAAAGAAAPVATASASLVFVNGTHAGQSIPLLPTTLTIGREHDNNIEIKDADVARYHARILYERGEYLVEDMDSTTGTWVNGKRVRRAALAHGDVIRVGQTELAIDFEWASDPN